MNAVQRFHKSTFEVLTGILNHIMADTFQQLLEATIEHLEDLKNRGDKYVLAQPDTLRALQQVPSANVRPPGKTAPVSSQSIKTVLPHAIPVATKPAVENQPVRADNVNATALAELKERALVCTRCPHLVKSRKQVVFGVGNPNAELMFIGEAPGADEDVQGEPFVGRAGQLLTKIIETMGLSRSSVYIGNILKCRPDMPAGEPGNRKPTAEEMETCIPWLLDQIEIIKPRVLVALGATAVEGLLGGKISITRVRGEWKEFHGTPLMPTFHPSYLLRGNDIGKKRMVWEDMLEVMAKLGMSISEKQRGFFLKR